MHDRKDRDERKAKRESMFVRRKESFAGSEYFQKRLFV